MLLLGSTSLIAIDTYRSLFLFSVEADGTVAMHSNKDF